jgi:hypothetical protein
MTTLHNNRKDIAMTRFAAVALFVFAGGFGISALLATSPAAPKKWHPKPRRECEEWFNKMTGDQKANIAGAFTKALERSKTEPEYRERLLDPAAALDAVEENVMANPGPKPAFDKKKQVIRFYEPEQITPSLPTKTNLTTYPNEHCYHIFVLPEANSQNVANFQDNIMCCYIPW